MEIQETNNYFILFPSYLLDSLSPHECILMGVLISLAKKEGYAYPSNDMLARTLKTSNSTIGRMLTKLETEGYIKRDIHRDLRGQVVSRHIYVLDALSMGGIPKTDKRDSLDMNIPPSPEMIITSYQNRPDNSITKLSKDDNKRDIEEAFGLLWEKYQRRGNKKTSLAAFSRLTKTDMRACWEHIPKYVDAHIKAGKLEYLPHLSTYINQRRWEDALPYQDSKQDISKTIINWNE